MAAAPSQIAMMPLRKSDLIRKTSVDRPLRGIVALSKTLARLLACPCRITVATVPVDPAALFVKALAEFRGVSIGGRFLCHILQAGIRSWRGAWAGLAKKPGPLSGGWVMR